MSAPFADSILDNAQPKKRLLDSAADLVASHSYICLSIIATLIIIIIWMYIYYHGVYFIGPFYKCESIITSQSDPDIDKLVDSINSSFR